MCHETAMPRFILDLRRAQPDNPGAWLLGEMEFRETGAVAVDGFAVRRTLTTDYGALILFDRTAPSVLLPFQPSPCKHLRDSVPQKWEQILLEPWVSTKPYVVARARMWQGDYARPMLAPRLDRVGNRPARGGQMVRLRVLADDQREA